jgi:hypothetical protein
LVLVALIGGSVPAHLQSADNSKIFRRLQESCEKPLLAIHLVILRLELSFIGDIGMKTAVAIVWRMANVFFLGRIYTSLTILIWMFTSRPRALESSTRRRGNLNLVMSRYFFFL